MLQQPRSPATQADGRTRERIIDAAIDLLDTEGTSGLTFRALAHKLATGHGAIQWHVASKNELLNVATVTVLTRELAAPVAGTMPQDAIRAVALDVFDALEAHPWLGRQLSAVPWQPAMARLWEQVGRPLEDLGVTDGPLFTAVSTLVSYIVGVGSQNAVNTHSTGAHAGRGAFLEAVASQWESAVPGEHSFIGQVADRLRTHDDRSEFLAGVNIILAGIAVSCDQP